MIYTGRNCRASRKKHSTEKQQKKETHKKTKEKNKKIAERKTGCGEGEPGRRI